MPKLVGQLQISFLSGMTATETVITLCIAYPAIMVLLMAWTVIKPQTENDRFFRPVGKKLNLEEIRNKVKFVCDLRNLPYAHYETGFMRKAIMAKTKSNVAKANATFALQKGLYRLYFNMNKSRWSVFKYGSRTAFVMSAVNVLSGFIYYMAVLYFSDLSGYSNLEKPLVAPELFVESWSTALIYFPMSLLFGLMIHLFFVLIYGIVPAIFSWRGYPRKVMATLARTLYTMMPGKWEQEESIF